MLLAQIACASTGLPTVGHLLEHQGVSGCLSKALSRNPARAFRATTGPMRTGPSLPPRTGTGARAAGRTGSFDAAVARRWPVEAPLGRSSAAPGAAPCAEDIVQLVAVAREVLTDEGRAPGETAESSVISPVDTGVDRSGRVAGVVLPFISEHLFNDQGVNTILQQIATRFAFQRTDRDPVLGVGRL